MGCSQSALSLLMWSKKVINLSQLHQSGKRLWPLTGGGKHRLSLRHGIWHNKWIFCLQYWCIRCQKEESGVEWVWQGANCDCWVTGSECLQNCSFVGTPQSVPNQYPSKIVWRRNSGEPMRGWWSAKATCSSSNTNKVMLDLIDRFQKLHKQQAPLVAYGAYGWPVSTISFKSFRRPCISSAPTSLSLHRVCMLWRKKKKSGKSTMENEMLLQASTLPSMWLFNMYYCVFRQVFDITHQTWWWLKRLGRSRKFQLYCP